MLQTSAAGKAIRPKLLLRRQLADHADERTGLSAATAPANPRCSKVLADLETLDYG